MAWKIRFAERALKDLEGLDRGVQRRILGYLETRIVAAGDPRAFGQALGGEKAGLWRYRVGDYRIVCRIEDDRLVVLVIRVGHRREVYRR